MAWNTLIELIILRLDKPIQYTKTTLKWSPNIYEAPQKVEKGLENQPRHDGYSKY